MMKLYRKIVNFYSYDLKLQYKFMLSHFILVLVPTLVISLLIYNQLSGVILSNTIHSELTLSRQTVSSIESSIEQVDQASNKIISDSFFTEMLQYDNATLRQKITSDPMFMTDTLKFLNTSSTLIDDLNISDIKIYLDSPFESLYSDPAFTSYDIFRPISDIEGSYWHGIFSSTNDRMLVCPSLYLTPDEMSKSGAFAIARKINYSNSTASAAAFVVVYFSKGNIDSILKKNISTTDSATYLVNGRNTLVSSSNPYLSGKYFMRYEEVAATIPDTTKFETRTFASQKTYIGYKEVSGTDWYMVSVIPVDSVLNQNRNILWLFVVSYFIFLGIAYFVSLKLSNSIARRISSVIKQMKLVEGGKPKPLERRLEHDEVGDLIDTYNYMSNEINNLMEKEVKAANDLRISEFKALQSQINPHFLYNTLDMINWLSKSGKSEEVSAAVQALSKFYKLTLGKGNIIVSIGEELSHVSLYVQLQNMRYKDKIHFFVDVPDDLLEYEIPKFVLQPIVENSIQHGIFGKESKEGNIVITGWAEDEDIVFIVSDDGIGVPPEKMETILSGKGGSSIGSNIGIYNTHKRLQLYYDKSYGLTYRSSETTGTEVEIRIPARKYDSSSL